MKKYFVLLCLLCVAPCEAGKGSNQRQALKRGQAKGAPPKKLKKKVKKRGGDLEQEARWALVEKERGRCSRAVKKGARRHASDSRSDRLIALTLAAAKRREKREHEEKLKQQRETRLFAQLLTTAERIKAEPPHWLRLKAEKNKKLYGERMARQSKKDAQVMLGK